MTPMRPSPETLFHGEASALARAFSRCSTRTLWRPCATAGTGTKRMGLRSKGTMGAGSPSAPKVTGPRRWLTRVVVRSMTGCWSSRASNKASRVMSLASCAVAGSKQGIPINRAYVRLSCSSWLEWHKGSSALTSTKPPGSPTYAAVNSGSAATLTPTCFIVVMLIAPARAAPAPTSTATFSLTEYSMRYLPHEAR